jgi:hypothetical protein
MGITSTLRFIWRANFYGRVDVPMSDSSIDQRLRGHSSFLGMLYASIMCAREERKFSATFSIQKLKDEYSGVN